MNNEFQSHLHNETFVDVLLPPGRSAIKSKWVSKKSVHADEKSGQVQGPRCFYGF